MSQPLHIRLLGGLHIAIPQKPALRFSARRAELLLAYLALNRREHSRETLATLLWDDRPHKQAMANLRALLAQLPAAVRPYLQTSRHVVMFKPEADIWVDSRAFTELLDKAETPSQMTEALELYAGPFLDGVFVRESRGLEEWTAILREQLNYKAIEAQMQIVQQALHQRHYTLGIRHARSLLALDPLREQAHRLLMRLLARDGQINAALAQYDSCCAILAEELGVEPATETRRLKKRIEAARQQSHPSLPAPTTPFLGREEELTRVSELLDQPNCRLLTIVGTGGVGKTRLALQTAAAQQYDYLNGTYFVPLSTVETAVDLPLTLAKQLNLAFHGQATPETQLLEALADKELLLILDNIEHLLPEAGQFITRLLAAAPEVTLLITSRERLRLPAEHSFELLGLNNQAVAEQFFVTCARRVLPDFSLTAATQTAVHHICQLVDGLPLGIELAAAWVHMLPCAEIAQEIEQNIDFLAAPQQERPERHQSLRAVFEYSWHLLAPAEQAALQKLSVFRGGFTRDAARLIAGANLLLLRSLVDKSLLYRISDDGERYGLLEVVRQHVRSKWADAEQEAATLNSHSAYYGRFLQTHEANLRGQSRAETVRLLAVELENCRRAWQTAVSRQPLDLEALSSFVEGLYAIFHTRAWFNEGYELLYPALERLQVESDTAVRNIILSRLLTRLGSLAAHTGQFQLALTHHRASLAHGENVSPPAELASNYIGLAQVSEILGHIADAKTYAQAAYNLYQAEEDEEGMVVALRKLGTVAQGSGQFEEAITIYQHCLTICRRNDDRQGIARASNGLGNALADFGRFAEAHKAYQESLTIYRQLQDRYSIALVLSNIGTIDSVLGDQEAARYNYQESYDICAEIGDRAGMGITLMNVALTHEREGEWEQARDLHLQAIKILRQANYISVLPSALTNLGTVFARLGDGRAGRAFLHESLEISHTNKLAPLLLRAIWGVGFLLKLEGDFQQALSLALVAAGHPVSNQETVQLGNELAAEAREQLTAVQIAAAEAWAANSEFEEVVTAVFAETAPELAA
ncbi:MAG: tetratricopeptide repeat protein [Ardenticatenaceae bacterium]|nr:tetratricopeptide repeat protein [Ardenticatenaceae bacterium]